MRIPSKKLVAATLVAGGVASAGGLAYAGHLNSVLEGDLRGRNEVAAGSNRRIVGDPNGRGEIYVFGIDNDVAVPGGQAARDNADTLCYVLIVDKIGELSMAPGGGRAAHIHRGRKGQNGPVVANLAWPQNGQAADCLFESEPGKFVGASAGIVREILANPSEFYVNVHNAEYPSGAIRAQLEGQEDDDHHD